MNHDIHCYATYVPQQRVAAGGEGSASRVAAAYDEDATTMAVAAARALPASARAGHAEQLLLCTSTPAYLDKTNAATVHAALGLPVDVLAADVIGTARSTTAALRAAAERGGLVTMADVRVGRPGSADERSGADAAAAFSFGPGPGIARILGVTSLTHEVLDRWRLPTAVVAQQWEERFGAEQMLEPVRAAAAQVLAGAGLEQADHVVVTSPNAVTRRAAAKLVPGRVSTSIAPVGHAGASDPGLALASALDGVGAGESILVLSVVDGCDAILVAATDRIDEGRQSVPLVDQLSGGDEVPYVRYLAWRGLIDPEPPRRPEPARPAGPPSARGAGWKFGLSGSRCGACGFLHLPPARVCHQCAAVDAMTPEPVADTAGTVATFTVDRLAYSPSPPVVDAVVDLDGGGRCTLEVADARVAELAVGDRVDLVFRRLFTAGGVHNYFWKARSAPSTDREDSR